MSWRSRSFSFIHSSIHHSFIWSARSGVRTQWWTGHTLSLLPWRSDSGEGERGTFQKGIKSMTVWLQVVGSLRSRGIAQRAAGCGNQQGFGAAFLSPWWENASGLVSTFSTLSNPSPYETAFNSMWLAWPGFYNLRESPPPSLGGWKETGFLEKMWSTITNSTQFPFLYPTFTRPKQELLDLTEKRSTNHLTGFCGAFLTPPYQAAQSWPYVSLSVREVKLVIHFIGLCNTKLRLIVTIFYWQCYLPHEHCKKSEQTWIFMAFFS